MAEYISTVRVGDTICILSLAPNADGNHDPAEKHYVGKEGVVQSIDDKGNIHGTWGGISLLHGLDSYAIIKRAPLKEGEFTKLDYFEKMAFGIPDELFYEGRADRSGSHNFDDFIHSLNGR